MQYVTDSEVIVGNREGVIDIDFNKMTERDLNGTKFEVGGRMFFEAHVFGIGLTSFTTNGFVDKEGYVEPVRAQTTQQVVMSSIGWTTAAGVGALVLTLILCRVMAKNKKTA